MKLPQIPPSPTLRLPARTLLALMATAASVSAAEPAGVTVDFSAPLGKMRAIHGINKGPLALGGLSDLTEPLKQLHPPSARLHDCHWPNPDVVDIHAVFPNPDADPTLPASYDFRATDEYIAATLATGAEIIYRLGQSIEWQKIKRHVDPPKDPAHWAAVCAGIVRHYNEGWAGGFHYGIRYWEIWNEPENRPVMWTGNDAQFLELYQVTARTLRKEFPSIKIGGCGFGYYGDFEGTTIKLTPFLTSFLDLCRRESLPLDFFSWHCYTDDPAEPVARAREVRRILDARGFKTTESHLNEWNYLPDKKFAVLQTNLPIEVRQRSTERMSGAPGGAYLVATLIGLQDAPVDMTNFYHGETQSFGLFTEVGAPTRNYHAMLAYARMLETPSRVSVAGGIPGKLAIMAGTDAAKKKAAILIGNPGGPEEITLTISKLPWENQTEAEVRIVDESHTLEPATYQTLLNSSLKLKLASPAVALVTLRPKATGK